MTDAALAQAPATPLIPDLLPRCDAAVAAAAGLVTAARARLAARVAAGGRVSNAALEADQAAAHGLAWMATYAEALRQLAAWARRARGRRPPRRAGAADPADRHRRVPRPARRRHPDVAERVRPSARPRPRRARAGRLPHPRPRRADRPRQRRRRPRPPRRHHRGNRRRRELRRHRPRRRPRDDPRPVPPLRRRARGPLRPRVAPEGRADPARDRRGDGRARRLRPDHPRGVRRRRPLQDRDVRRLRGALAAATSASARSAPAPRSPPS